LINLFIILLVEVNVVVIVVLVVDVAIIKFFRIVYIVLKKILFNFLLFIVVSFLQLKVQVF
jgi:hypothetical protein